MLRTSILGAAKASALAGVFAFGLSAAAQAQTANPAVIPDSPADKAERVPQPNAEMAKVLEKLAELGAEPIGTLSVEETRAQPTPADAVMAVMEEENIQPDAAAEAIATRDIQIPGPAGSIEARVYTPEGEGPFPLVVYFHGGGWVIADIDTYDASPRALAAGANAVVVAASYRQGPENKFPAAHEDAVAAYRWIVENSGQLNADANRIALAGESAGGNLAANVAIAARDQQLQQPLHQVLVYPVAGDDMETESYVENEVALPLSKAGMMWFVQEALETESQAADPRIDLNGRDDLAGLPPATIITAQIDPLRSDGETFAERLRAAGVEVDLENYEGVTHEFFGMGTVVPQAKEAVELANRQLTAAFEAAETTSSTDGAAPTPTPAPAANN